MHIHPASHASTQAARAARFANRKAARSRRDVASTYRAPSLLQLKPGPLSKLAWIFGLR
jgi:hypothetical protein